MKDLEKQIEEAAYNNTESLNFSHNSLETKTMAKRLDKAFITGAKSEEAKEYWQQGMYSEEEVKFYCTRFAHQLRLHECHTNDDTCKLFDKWVEQNKKK